MREINKGTKLNCSENITKYCQTAQSK